MHDPAWRVTLLLTLCKDPNWDMLAKLVLWRLITTMRAGHHHTVQMRQATSMEWTRHTSVNLCTTCLTQTSAIGRRGPQSGCQALCIVLLWLVGSTVPCNKQLSRILMRPFGVFLHKDSQPRRTTRFLMCCMRCPITLRLHYTCSSCRPLCSESLYWSR